MVASIVHQCWHSNNFCTLCWNSIITSWRFRTSCRIDIVNPPHVHTEGIRPLIRFRNPSSPLLSLKLREQFPHHIHVQAGLSHAESSSLYISLPSKKLVPFAIFQKFIFHSVLIFTTVEPKLFQVRRSICRFYYICQHTYWGSCDLPKTNFLGKSMGICVQYVLFGIYYTQKQAAGYKRAHSTYIKVSRMLYDVWFRIRVMYYRHAMSPLQ